MLIKCIFDSATNRGVDIQREPKEGEYAVILPISELKWFPNDPERYQLLNGSVVTVPNVVIRAEKKERRQKDIWEKIKEERTRRWQESGYKVDGNWYHSDPISRIQQMGLYIMGDDILATMWKTMKGDLVPMNRNLAGNIFRAAAAFDHELFQAAEMHKAAMELLDDPRDYDFSTGWPKGFRI